MAKLVKMDPKIRLALFIGIQVVALAGAAFFSYRPSVKAIDELDGEITRLSERQAALCKILKDCPNPEDEIAHLKAEIQQLENRIPPETRVSWLSACIADAMQEHSIDLRSATDWAEGGNPPPAPALKRLQKTINVLCTAEQLQAFLNAVNKLPFVVVVEELDVSRDKKWGTVSANIRLAAFVLRSAPPSAAPPSAAPPSAAPPSAAPVPALPVAALGRNIP